MQIRQLFFNPITVIVVSALCILFIFSLQATQNTTKKQFEKYKNQEEIIKEKEKELTELQTETKDLDDPFYQEKVLRDELLLQKEGEKIIQLPPLDQVEKKPVPTPAPVTPWSQWRQLLFN